GAGCELHRRFDLRDSRSSNPGELMLKKFLSSWKVQVGLAIIIFFVLLAIFGEFLVRSVMGIDPLAVNYDALAQPPSSEYLLGKSRVGGAVFAHAVSGASGSVAGGFISCTIGVVIGVLIGTWSGYSAEIINRSTMAVVNVLMTLP